MIEDALNRARNRSPQGLKLASAPVPDEDAALKIADALEYAAIALSNDGTDAGAVRGEMVRNFFKEAAEGGAPASGETQASGVQAEAPRAGSKKIPVSAKGDAPVVSEAPEGKNPAKAAGGTLWDVLMARKQADGPRVMDSADTASRYTGTESNAQAHAALATNEAPVSATRREMHEPTRKSMAGLFSATGDTAASQASAKIVSPKASAAGNLKNASFSQMAELLEHPVVKEAMGLPGGMAASGAMLGGGLGAGMGAIAGGEGHRGRGALIGGGAGALGGALAGGGAGALLAHANPELAAASDLVHSARELHPGLAGLLHPDVQAAAEAANEHILANKGRVAASYLVPAAIGGGAGAGAAYLARPDDYAKESSAPSILELAQAWDAAYTGQFGDAVKQAAAGIVDHIKEGKRDEDEKPPTPSAGRSLGKGAIIGGGSGAIVGALAGRGGVKGRAAQALTTGALYGGVGTAIGAMGHHHNKKKMREWKEENE